MSSIHKLSAVTALPEFDLFAVPPTQTTVEKDLCSEQRPISTLDSRSTIEFIINSNIDEYVNFRETILFLKLQLNLSKKDRTDVVDTDWSNVTPVNNMLHSMFQHIDIVIGDRQINNSATTYPYRAYLETLLNASEESKNTFLAGALWTEDESERRSYLQKTVEEKTRSVDLMGRMHLDLTFQDRAVIGGASIRVKLVTHDPKFFLNVIGDYAVSVTFLEACLFVHKSKISRDILSAHSKAIDVAPAKYPITRTEVKSFTINKGSLDCSIENAVNGQLPRRVYIGLVGNDAFNGAFSKNPFDFKHFNVNFITCYVDGSQFPAKAFTPDFKNNFFIREYMSLFEASNQIYERCNVNIRRKDYTNEKVLYGFNFAPDLSDGCQSGHVNFIKKGSMRVEIHFAEPLQETINVVVYCEFDNIIEINSSRNAVIEY